MSPRVAVRMNLACNLRVERKNAFSLGTDIRGPRLTASREELHLEGMQLEGINCIEFGMKPAKCSATPLHRSLAIGYVPPLLPTVRDRRLQGVPATTIDSPENTIMGHLMTKSIANRIWMETPLMLPLKLRRMRNKP
jgi:hypothetical protein